MTPPDSTTARASDNHRWPGFQWVARRLLPPVVAAVLLVVAWAIVVEVWQILESLRQPIEDGVVHISRAAADLLAASRYDDGLGNRLRVGA